MVFAGPALLAGRACTLVAWEWSRLTLLVLIGVEVVVADVVA